MSEIQWYAEHLLNLRQVSLYISLPTKSGHATAIKLSKDHQSLSVTHKDLSTIVSLPTNVSSNSSITPQIGTKDLSFRLQAQPKSAAALNGNLASNNEWIASNLKPGTKVACVKCAYVLVKNVSRCKELPSGGWADMMDLWHCHKPTVADSQSMTAGSKKGYAAGHAIGAVAGCGLIDIMSIIFLANECIGLEVSEQNSLLGSYCVIRGQEEGGFPCTIMVLPWYPHRYNCPRKNLSCIALPTLALAATGYLVFAFASAFHHFALNT